MLYDHNQKQKQKVCLICPNHQTCVTYTHLQTMELSNTTCHHQQEQQQQQKITTSDQIIALNTTSQDVNDDDDDDEEGTPSKDTKKDQSVVVVVNVGPTTKRYKYRECMRNHAASIGGNARDGCGEFMPQQQGLNANCDDNNSNQSLYCSVCTCHRNFHRKELLVQHQHQLDQNPNNMIIRPSPSPSSTNLGYPIMPHNRYPHHPMIMSYNPIINYPDETHQHVDDDDDHHHHNNNANVVGMRRPGNKRFRTKFSQEQREKMLSFAERVGWKIQKQEDSVVQSFCQEIGVKRRVLKVWMHNNKHNFAKKIPPPNSSS